MNTPAPSANSIADRSFELFVNAIHKPSEYNIRVVDVGDAKVLDFASDRDGTTSAGIVLSEICMGGLGEVKVKDPGTELGLREVHVATRQPLEACIGAQYAGWPVAKDAYFAMGSGPMRMLRGKEEILSEYDLEGEATHAVGVLESNKLPTEAIIQLIADECHVHPRDVCLCVARTASLPGSVQVVARSIETALHKLHELKFDLKTIRTGAGSAPLPPLAKDDLTALGWTNDAMLYGAKVKLTVETDDESIEQIAEHIPSNSSSEFGTPFLEIFEKYDRDFYKVDKMLFSPAEITIVNRTTGRQFHVGEVRHDILKQSFGIE